MWEGEEATGEGGQKDCSPGWQLERDWEGEEEGGILLTAPPLLLTMPALALLLPSPPIVPTTPCLPTTPGGEVKPFWWGGRRGEAVGGGRCLGGDGEGCGWSLPIPPMAELCL